MTTEIIERIKERFECGFSDSPCDKCKIDCEDKDILKETIEALEKQKRYKLLVRYLIYYKILGEGICDVIDEDWCCENCNSYYPNELCYEKFMEYLENEEVEE